MQLIEHLTKIICKLQKQKKSIASTVFKKWIKFKCISNSNTSVQHKSGLFIYIHISTQHDHALFFRMQLTGETFLISMLALLKTTFNIK